jgi:hypothetical protein
VTVTPPHFGAPARQPRPLQTSNEDRLGITFEIIARPLLTNTQRVEPHDAGLSVIRHVGLNRHFREFRVLPQVC